MEAVRDFITVQDPGRGPPRPDNHLWTVWTTPWRYFGRWSSTAAGDSALWDFRAASDFAGQVEELSRAVDYLQLVAAAAVDRTRKQSADGHEGRATAWTTGWRTTPRRHRPSPRCSAKRRSKGDTVGPPAGARHHLRRRRGPDVPSVTASGAVIPGCGCPGGFGRGG